MFNKSLIIKIRLINDNTYNSWYTFICLISDRLAISTGSACSAGEPSYVISELGLKEQVNKVLRISLNKYTTEDEVGQLIKILKDEV